MKKILLLFIGMSFAMSCSKNDDNEAIDIDYTTAIIGKWVISDFYDSSVKGLEELEKVAPCLSKGFNTFNSNGSVLETEFSGKDCKENSVKSKNYSISLNILTIREKGAGKDEGTDYVVRYFIKELTKSKLVIQGFYIDSGDMSVDPVLREHNYFTFTYRKIK